MNRPSQNLDLQLIAAGMELLPATGCAKLSVRQLVEHAGVNLGMFHYHFKNKDNFIRTVLQRFYEEMFAALQLQGAQEASPLENLRRALTVLGLFAHKNRKLMVMLVAEAMRGDALPSEFLRANLPRHIRIIAGFVALGQADGSIVQAPFPRILPFLFGAVAAPLLASAAIQQHQALPPELAAVIEIGVMSEQALSQRIAFALRGISTSPTPTGMP